MALCVHIFKNIQDTTIHDSGIYLSSSHVQEGQAERFRPIFPQFHLQSWSFKDQTMRSWCLFFLLSSPNPWIFIPL